MTFLREQGILKRMRGTLVPPGAFFGGVVGNAVVNALVQIALLIGVGHLLFEGDLPRNWLTLAVFTVVGVATFACLGIAFAQLIPNFDAAPAYTNAVFLPAIFISGVFYSTEKMPRALANHRRRAAAQARDRRAARGDRHGLGHRPDVRFAGDPPGLARRRAVGDHSRLPLGSLRQPPTPRRPWRSPAPYTSRPDPAEADRDQRGAQAARGHQRPRVMERVERGGR